MTTRAQVVAEALTWVGTPYQHQGALKGVAVDCAMQCVRVYGACGLCPADLDPRPYPPQWHLHRSAERYLGWVEQYARPTEQPGPGDLVVYRFGRAFSHGGIIVEWPDKVVHALARSGVCEVGRGDAGPLADRPRKFYTFWSS